jgi:hypothetical protein
VAYRSTYGSLMVGAGTALLATCLVSGVVGCSKKKEEDAKAQAEKAEAAKKKKPTGDRYADGQRLGAALKDWTKRWSDTPDLPPCDPLLKDAAELELCKTAQTALGTMKAAAAKPEPEAVLIHDAAELAFATEAASEKLRMASMAKMEAERKAAPATSGVSAAKPAPALSAAAKVRPLGSAGKAAIADKLGGKMKPVEAPPLDPAQQALQAFSRVNRASLRYLSQFLQFGPLKTRGVAYAELESLSKRKEAWPALGRTLREAAMTENDPDLQGKLKALAPKLARRGPGAMPGMPGMPAGHPAPEPGATPPAPAGPDKE